MSLYVAKVRVQLSQFVQVIGSAILREVVFQLLEILVKTFSYCKQEAIPYRWLHDCVADGLLALLQITRVENHVD